MDGTATATSNDHLVSMDGSNDLSLDPALEALTRAMLNQQRQQEQAQRKLSERVGLVDGQRETHDGLVRAHDAGGSMADVTRHAMVS